jgi:hypothetical protein
MHRKLEMVYVLTVLSLGETSIKANFLHTI